METHKDYFKNKNLENLGPHWIASDRLKASIKSYDKAILINEDDLIESVLNEINDHERVKHDCIN